MSDTRWVAAGTGAAVHKISPGFCPGSGLRTDPECISERASLKARHAGASRGVGLFTHAALNTQDFIKSITGWWCPLHVIHMHVHPPPLASPKRLVNPRLCWGRCWDIQYTQPRRIHTHTQARGAHHICTHEKARTNTVKLRCARIASHGFLIWKDLCTNKHARFVLWFNH